MPPIPSGTAANYVTFL